MRYYKIFLSCFLVLTSITLLHKIPFLENQVNRLGVHFTEQEFGSGRISEDQEGMIYGIADELGIDRSTLEIRKTNQKYLQSMGYYNAFYVSSVLFRVFPIGGKRFVYVSEGFMKKLSQPEQRFLIGHELIHAKHRHVRYLDFMLFFVRWFVITSLVYLYTFLTRSVCPSGKPIAMSKCLLSRRKAIALCFVLYLISMVSIYLGGLAYRRHIEWVADKESIALLGTSEGCVKFMDRLTNEFGMPADNVYSCLADHPSCRDRKNYSLGVNKLGK